MKVRAGYVSNSSSSSFCVLGITQSALMDKNPQIAEAFDNGDCEDLEEYLGIDWNTKDVEVVSGISEYYDEHIVGMSATKMKENETLLDFKKRVAEWLKNKGLSVEVSDINWHIDGGMDN